MADFVTYEMSVPAGRKGQNVSYLRHTESVGKSIVNLIAGQQSSGGKDFTGYSARYDPETKKVVLGITAAAEEQELVAAALRQASIYRGKGAYSPTAKKGIEITSAPAEQSTVSLEKVPARAAADMRYKAIRSFGESAVTDKGDLALPSGIPYTAKATEKAESSIVDRAMDMKQDTRYINTEKLRALNREREDRAAYYGVRPADLNYQVPKDNPYGINQEFVDRQNKKLQQERNKGSQLQGPLMIMMIYKAVMTVISVLQSLYKLAKEGMDRAAEASFSGLAAGISPVDMAAASQTDIRYGLKEGTTASGYQALIGGLNTPFGLNTKMIENLAIMGSAAGDSGLVKSAIDTAVSGQNVSVIYSQIMSAAHKLIAEGKDLTGKNIGKDESARAVIGFLSSSGLGPMAQALTAQEQSAKNTEDNFVYKQGGISVSSNDIAGATAAKEAAGQLKAGVESIAIKLASWMNSVHILDNIYRLLLNWKGTETDKAEYAIHIQQQNKENMEAAQSTLDNIKDSSDVQKVVTATRSAASGGIPLSQITERGIGPGSEGYTVQDIIDTINGKAPLAAASSSNPGSYTAAAIARISNVITALKDKYGKGSSQYQELEEVQKKLFALKSIATVQAELGSNVYKYWNTPLSTAITTMSPLAAIARGQNSAYLGLSDATLLRSGNNFNAAGYLIPSGITASKAYVQQVAAGLFDQTFTKSLVNPEAAGKVSIDWTTQLKLESQTGEVTTVTKQGNTNVASGANVPLVVEPTVLNMSRGQSTEVYGAKVPVK